MCRQVKSNANDLGYTSNRNSVVRIIIPYLILSVVVMSGDFEFIYSPWLKNDTANEPHSKVLVRPDRKTFHHSACSSLNALSATDLWLDLQYPVIFNSTYLPQKKDGEIFNSTTPEYDSLINNNMVTWTQSLLEFYTPERMRPSIANRPSNPTILKVLSIISNYSKTKVPLKILVTGGSVTAGHWCVENPVGWEGGKGGAPFKDCAWPSRLERHLRKLFFNDVNEPGIIVYNMAVGATSVNVATMILEYELLPDDLLSPDVILLAHSPNDANMLNADDLFYNHLNNAVQAAKRLRECDDDLPLVGLIDDNVGMTNISKAMETTARYYSIASWYQLLMINYGNVVRQTLLQRYSQNRTEPLMGGIYKLHMGMGFHMGMAWTIVFDILSVMIDACFDSNEEDLASEPISLEEWENESKLSSLEGRLWKKSPSKQFGGLHLESNPASVKSDWMHNLRHKELNCKSFNSSESVLPVCTYAWMVNKLASIMHPKDIEEAFSGVMKSSVGWKAMGNFYSFPRLGYYAQDKNAHFSLEIYAAAPTLYFTVLSTESYGPNFVDSNLSINVEIQRSTKSVNSKEKLWASYNISGYHKIETSSHEIHKYRLPSLVNPGDVIFFNATLTSGSYFKIAGLAFCKR